MPTVAVLGSALLLARVWLCVCEDFGLIDIAIV